jgi:tetratricopeptide (TPR) repeat protein
LSTLATRAPVLLVIEDAHWADSATLALLRHLARRLRRSRALIIATHRESSLDETRFFHEWLGDLQHECEATLINLTRLDKDRTRDLLAAIFREAITPEFLDGIYDATEGNPFFVTEVCQALIDEGAVYRASEGWQRLSMAQIQIPKSVRLAIQRRVAQLSKAAQETLQRAAMLGREFEFDVLQAMSDLDEEGLIDALETAERAQLIAEVTRPSRTARLSFTFVHALIPSTLDEELNTVRRQRLHHRAAAAIESLHPNDVEALAYHFAAAGERDKAIGYSCLAAERAEALYAYDTAIQHLQIALDLIEAGEQNETRMAVLEKLADAHRLRGERAEAIQIYQQALEVWRRMTNADKWLAVRLHRKIGETFNHLATGADIERFRAMALSGLESALKLIEGEPPHPESARLLTTVANTAYWRAYGPADALPDQSEMEHYARAAVAMAEKLNAPVELSAALEALANIYSAQGLLRERMQIGLRRLALSRDPRFTDRREQVNMLCQVGTALCSVGDYVQALTYLLEAERLADEIRDSDDVIQALGMQVQCFFGLDRWEEILQVEDKRLALQAHYGSARIGRICRQCGVSAYVYGWRGEMELARSNREEVYNNHTKLWGPTESWPVIGHY